MAQKIPFLYNPKTRIGFQVVKTAKGERLEKFLAFTSEKKVILRRDDFVMSAAIYNRTAFKWDACDTEGAF